MVSRWRNALSSNLTKSLACPNPTAQTPLLPRPRQQGDCRPPRPQQDSGRSRSVVQPAAYGTVQQVEPERSAVLAFERFAVGHEGLDPSFDRQGQGVRIERTPCTGVLKGLLQP